jgi:Tol biopolymer transport system component
MRISPDGQRVAYSRAEPKIGTFDLWVAETAREGMQRLTSARTSEVSPVWLPDRPELLFAGGIGAPHIVRKSLVDGTEVELMPGSALQYPEDVSRDGRTLVFVERGPTFDIWAVPMDHPTDRRPLLQTPFNEYQPRLSPDGRFFAFVSNESGRNEVYVSAFPPRGLKTPASTAGGTIPRWSRDGRELYFLSSDRRLMKVDVRTAPVLAVGTAETLFPLAGQRIWKDYDVAPDGARFLAVVTDQLGDERPMTVVTNWRPERSP